MKKLLIAVPLAFILAGCSYLKGNYGTYNVGVCNIQFVASHLDVSAKEIKVLAVATSPKDIIVVPEAIVLRYDKTVNSKRVYLRGNGAEMDIVLKDGELSGEFVVDGQKVASLHGFKGEQANLGEAGKKEAQACYTGLGDIN